MHVKWLALSLVLVSCGSKETTPAGGATSAPPAKVDATTPAPPAAADLAQRAEIGAGLYAKYCALCHG